jgi:hypothetical protein
VTGIRMACALMQIDIKSCNSPRLAARHHGRKFFVRSVDLRPQMLEGHGAGSAGSSCHYRLQPRLWVYDRSIARQLREYPCAMNSVITLGEMQARGVTNTAAVTRLQDAPSFSGMPTTWTRATLGTAVAAGDPVTVYCNNYACRYRLEHGRQYRAVLSATGATLSSPQVPADDRFLDPEQPFVAAAVSFRSFPKADFSVASAQW